mmetsp:Transcript_37927/g.114585  ORF Transcript_37927/g.114585 Transcript_37927/m.114585 type:complete len:213 (-) Transcript_37927:1380-2018(-)
MRFFAILDAQPHAAQQRFGANRCGVRDAREIAPDLGEHLHVEVVRERLDKRADRGDRPDGPNHKADGHHEEEAATRNPTRHEKSREELGLASCAATAAGRHPDVRAHFPAPPAARQLVFRRAPRASAATLLVHEHGGQTEEQEHVGEKNASPDEHAELAQGPAGGDDVAQERHGGGQGSHQARGPSLSVHVLQALGVPIVRGHVPVLLALGP